MMTVRYCLVFFLFLSCVYGSINPRLLPAKTHIKMCMEAFILVVVYFLFINCGEDLAGCNATLWSAMGRSQWYNCSKKTRQAIVVFFSFNQNMEYFLLYNFIKMTYGLMISSFKITYSFLNFMTIYRNNQMKTLNGHLKLTN
jgi:hypothetical protein